MKTLYIVSIFCFTFLAAQAQEFEGIVTYQMKCESKIPNVPNEQFNALMGSEQKYYYRSGEYKMAGNGTLFQWQIFIKKDNKLYSKLSSTPSVYYDDVTNNKDEVLKAEIKKNAETVLGYLCDELTLTCTSGIQRYYYNARFNMDPKKFENFKFNNWYEYLSRAKAVPLKMYVETPQFNLESVATDIEEKKIDASIFKLPPGTAVEKNPY
jgi:hypothetical protein